MSVHSRALGVGMGGIVADADHVFGTAQESARRAGVTVRVKLNGDDRTAIRSIKHMQAVVDDTTHPHRARAVRALLSPEHPVRNALGELDDNE